MLRNVQKGRVYGQRLVRTKNFWGKFPFFSWKGWLMEGERGVERGGEGRKVRGVEWGRRCARTGGVEIGNIITAKYSNGSKLKRLCCKLQSSKSVSHFIQHIFMMQLFKLNEQIFC